MCASGAWKKEQMRRVCALGCVLGLMVLCGCSTRVYEFDDDRYSANPRGESHEVDVFDGARALDGVLRGAGR